MSTNCPWGDPKLLSPIQYIKGVGPRLAALFSKKGVHTIRDALYYFPRTYEDRREIKEIIDLQPGSRQMFTGTVLNIKELRTRMTKTTILSVHITDHTAHIALKWFKGKKFIKNKFKKGQKILVNGPVSVYAGSFEVHHPEVEILYDPEQEELLQDKSIEDFKGIAPIYSETEGLHQKTIRRIIHKCIEEKLLLLDEYMPETILKEHNMLNIRDAIKSLHMPRKDANIERLYNFSSRGHLRLIFNEFLLVELIMAKRRQNTKAQKGISFNKASLHKEKILSTLSFSLTKAQETVLNQIETDLTKEVPMNRLLQGDVGSGKTLVALISTLHVISNDYQAVLMVPTEILATQHFKTAKKLFEPLGIQCSLLVSGMKATEKNKIREDIANGKSQLIIGTHALIQDKVEFHNLGFAVIDEQHRFGVKQRQAIKGKAKENIDLLIMTATPIPRTLALTAYGDLDLSVIDEMPPGRTPIETKIFYERSRDKLYDLIKARVQNGEQVYIVYPLVAESEKLDLKDATNMYQELSKKIFPDFKVALIHGKLKQEQKDTTMNAFKDGLVDILISTTVIEVGVDVPNATLMVIEHSERFGLSQLHQLRGRVGRGEKASMCALMTNFKRSELAEARLDVMAETNDGFKISEEDLNIRGPGEFLGTRQAGVPCFQLGNILRDHKVLEFAKEKAEEILSKDPHLNNPENQKLKAVIQHEEENAFWG